MALLLLPFNSQHYRFAGHLAGHLAGYGILGKRQGIVTQDSRDPHPRGDRAGGNCG
ncbi:MAG: hypothetical protein VKL01_04340 [Limnothrix sp.]|uniref:hypothetical protein n=1 Tax=unclassified Limnothrix TaxID=2632864 RepID=UPI001304495C|nr:MULTISPECIES: hypothetical protein [unclassified Limnothrix]MBD2160182.1 hypothetical protein [Limnothrix sp. FACHB-1083]MBD2190885.1 hypothetical protein [Limnothrix sp. FACHB-1088]MBD2634092.1 hypothetical protein [Limnothrix sp. FACHB-881]MEB3117577.1 hypothetical protein [Limnothrix sp.]